MPNPISVDYSIFPKLDLTFTPMTDQAEIYLQNAYKRITTSIGVESPASGQFWSPTTINIRDYIKNTMSPQSLDELRGTLISIFDTETRYNVTFQCSFLQGVLKINMTLRMVDDFRPIQAVISVTSAEITFERIS